MDANTALEHALDQHAASLRLLALSLREVRLSVFGPDSSTFDPQTGGPSLPPTGEPKIGSPSDVVGGYFMGE